MQNIKPPALQGREVRHAPAVPPYFPGLKPGHSPGRGSKTCRESQPLPPTTAEEPGGDYSAHMTFRLRPSRAHSPGCLPRASTSSAGL